MPEDPTPRQRLRQLKNPPNPWISTVTEHLGPPPEASLEVFFDSSRQALSKNTSPDIPFTWSVNPYRGCYHGCAYCYARPSHEYLSLGAGTDFERKIVVKPEAPTLLREAFERPKWTGELVVFSGVTDCYQPLEAKMRLTRGCLEVCAEYKNPVGIITKSPIVERDIDVLQTLTKEASARVMGPTPYEHRRRSTSQARFRSCLWQNIRTVVSFSAPRGAVATRNLPRASSRFSPIVSRPPTSRRLALLRRTEYQYGCGLHRWTARGEMYSGAGLSRNRETCSE